MADERAPPIPNSWLQAAIWMGSDFFGLMRILKQHGWRIEPAYLPGCLIDLAFAAVNSGLGCLESMIYRSRINRVTLDNEPVFIIGHWRTGTTLLHELLTLDARHSYPTTYQCFLPAHFLLTESLVKGWSSFALPRQRPPDNMPLGWDTPQEDEFALCNLGIPSPYASIAFPNIAPQYEAYLNIDTLSAEERRSWTEKLTYFLKKVHYRKPGRMILKSPPHTFRLPTLVDLFPRARFINLVRHPVTVFLSTMRLWKSLYSSHAYQKANFDTLEEGVLTRFLDMHEHLEASRCIVLPERFIDLRYEDLLKDMMGTVGSIYDRFELGEFESCRPSLTAFLRSRADYQPHCYQPNPDTVSRVYRRWKPYYEKYGYEEDTPG